MSLEDMVPFARSKSSANWLVDLFHIWPWALTLAVRLAMNFQGQISKFPYPRNILSHPKEFKMGELFGWFIYSFFYNIWFKFYSQYRLQCRPDVTSLVTSMVISLLQQRWCVFGMQYMLGWCFGFHAIYQSNVYKIRAILTHWGRYKMDVISQTTFSCMKMFEFRFEFHWSLFLRVQLTIFQHWFR